MTARAKPDYFTTPAGHKIAFHQHGGKAPGVVFLGGFMSDMNGSKATYLESWAKADGHSFLRFDYSGHGQSSGAFTQGSIGAWAEDAAAIINAQTKGPQLLIGSSMGGWISLILAQRKLVNIAGFLGIAAAPDFTQDSMWAQMSDEQRRKLETEGQIEVPSDYDDPYPITKQLIEDGRNHLILRAPLDLPFPVHLLHGTADRDVEMSRPLAIMDHATCADMSLTFVKGANHSFSAPENLALMSKTAQEILSKTT